MLGHIIKFLSGGASGAPTAVSSDNPLPVSITSTSNVIEGEGTAGTPAGGVVSVQGVASGTPMPVVPTGITITITPTLDTGAYVSNDVLFIANALANAVRVTGGRATLTRVCLIDVAKQAAAMELIFSNATVDPGAANAAEALSAADALKVVGRVQIVAGDWDTKANYSIADITGIFRTMKAAATSLFVHGVSKGTPDYVAATDLQITFEFEYAS